ncbi:MAG: hypothetical protein M3P33_01955 [bacterium]|nr:hypothetical protein [bacterium]
MPKVISNAKESGYQIECAHTFVFPCDYVKGYRKQKINREQLIVSEVKMARAWSEGSIAGLLGKDQIENFYDELTNCLKKSPEQFGSDYHLQFLILKHPS